MRNYPEKPDTVYFFGTCLIDMAYPQAGMAGIRLIQREGVKVIFPKDQSCCGQPAYNSGFPEEARAVASKQLKAFSKNYPVIVPSGSCAGMMRLHYPKLFQGRPEADAVESFSQRIFELTEFLVKVLNVQLEDKGQPVTVTWHSSCHAAREMEIIGESKSLIRQLKNVRLVELAKEEQCCGFGGTFSVKQPDISAALVKDKIADIENTGAAKVLTGDCGCLMNITGAMARQKSAASGQHIAEFLWERTDG
jgi:L-lactate dehydrogenase complex protein LldE